MTNIEKAVRLYKKFIDGARWLNAGLLRKENAKQDLEDFDRKVCLPLDELWQKLKPAEREALDKITEVIGIFDGAIELSNVSGIFIRGTKELPRDASPLCLSCDQPGERYCLGFTGKGYEWGMYCLECEPYDSFR